MADLIGAGIRDRTEDLLITSALSPNSGELKRIKSTPVIDEGAAKSPSDSLQAGKDAGKDMIERVCRKMGIEPNMPEADHA